MNPSRKTKPIVCRCPACNGGRNWSLPEVRAAAQAAGRPGFVVNALTLPGIAKAIGHPLEYDAPPVCGAWRRRTEADAVVRDDGRLPRLAAWRSDVMPVNGTRIGAADGPGALTT
jgi:hypothetical protein